MIEFAVEFLLELVGGLVGKTFESRPWLWLVLLAGIAFLVGLMVR